MKLGLIGITGSGKTTLFNSLSRVKEGDCKKASSGKKPNIKMVPVPDKRLEKLEEIFTPKKKTTAYTEFVDIAGLEKGGMGAGKRFLPNIRGVDALVHVLGCFSGLTDDTLKDIEEINIELMVSDLGIIEKRQKNIEKLKRNVSNEIKKEAEVLSKARSGIEEGLPLRIIGLLPDESKAIRSLELLTLKPVIYCINISEEDMGKDEKELSFIRDIRQYANKEGAEVLTVCAKIEEEISQLETEDKYLFMRELGIEESSLDKLVRSSYKTLGLISFLTAGPDEVRAWTVKKGTKAPDAASTIHSDIERGFIRAETISFEKFIEAGSFKDAKEKGLLKSEGKQYIVNDGDIIDFKFNV